MCGNGIYAGYSPSPGAVGDFRTDFAQTTKLFRGALRSLQSLRRWTAGALEEYSLDSLLALRPQPSSLFLGDMLARRQTTGTNCIRQIIS